MAVKAWLLMAKMEGEGGMAMVLVPRTRPEEPRETGVPNMVTAGLFGRMGVP